MNRLDEIEARANAATEGPWEVGDRYHCQAADMCKCSPDRGPLIDTYQHPKWGTMHVHRTDEPRWNDGVLFREAGGPPGEVASDLATEDAEFIAAARTTVPALLDLADAMLGLADDLDRDGNAFMSDADPGRAKAAYALAARIRATTTTALEGLHHA